MTDAIAMQMADQHGVNVAKTRVVSARYGHAWIIQQAGAVGIFKDHRAVTAAKRAGMAAKRSNLHILGVRCARNEDGGQSAEQNPLHDSRSLWLSEESMKCVLAYRKQKRGRFIAAGPMHLPLD